MAFLILLAEKLSCTAQGGVNRAQRIKTRLALFTRGQEQSDPSTGAWGMVASAKRSFPPLSSPPYTLHKDQGQTDPLRSQQDSVDSSWTPRSANRLKGWGWDHGLPSSTFTALHCWLLHSGSTWCAPWCAKQPFQLPIFLCCMLLLRFPALIPAF